MTGVFIYSLVLESTWCAMTWFAGKPEHHVLAWSLGLILMAMWTGFAFYSGGYGFLLGVVFGTGIYIRNLHLALGRKDSLCA